MILGDDKKLIIPLQELTQSLKGAFERRLEQVILFGSYARGDADSESDIDILVVLSDSQNVKDDEYQCLSISQHLSLNHDVVISCIVAVPQDFEIQRPLYTKVFTTPREGFHSIHRE